MHRLVSFGRAIFVLGTPLIIDTAPSLRVGLALALFKTGLGRSDGVKAGLPAFDLGGDIQLGLVLLGLVCSGSPLQQSGDLGFEICWRSLMTVPTHAPPSLPASCRSSTGTNG